MSWPRARKLAKPSPTLRVSAPGPGDTPRPGSLPPAPAKPTAPGEDWSLPHGPRLLRHRLPRRRSDSAGGRGRSLAAPGRADEGGHSGVSPATAGEVPPPDPRSRPQGDEERECSPGGQHGGGATREVPQCLCCPQPAARPHRPRVTGTMTPQAVQAERHPQARMGFQGPRRAAWEARASDPNLAAWHLLPPTRVGVGGWSQALGEGNPERAQQTPVSTTEAPQTLP